MMTTKNPDDADDDDDVYIDSWKPIRVVAGHANQYNNMSLR